MVWWFKRVRPVNDRVSRSGYWGDVWRRFRANRLAFISLVFVAILLVAAALGPLIVPYGYDQLDYNYVRQGPSLAHWAGCDGLGRDIFTRVIYSLRTASAVALGSVILNLLLGGVIGVLAGYRGGAPDNVLMRVTDVVLAFPSFLINVILVVVLGRGIGTIIIALALTGWAPMARLVRAQVASLKHREFVQAARSLGAADLHIVLRYIVPNAIPPLIVAVSFAIPNAMMIESGLSVMGMGVRPPIPSWGSMITDGIQYVRFSPHILALPAVSFALTLLAFTYTGDALQQALDPREEE